MPERTLAAFLAGLHRLEQFPELAKMRGLHNQGFWEDLMHDDLLGILLDLSGAVLFELCSEEAFGPAPAEGRWKEKLDVQLAAAHIQLLKWCADNGRECSQPKFRVLNLSMSTKDDWPCLKAKAHNSSVVGDWLATVAVNFVDTIYNEIRSVCVSAFASLWVLVQDTKFPNFVLSDDQVARASNLREEALLSYEWLSNACEFGGVCQYKIRPKYHNLEHGVRRMIRTKLSMSLSYSFSPEDVMGMCARMCNKTHATSMMRRGVGRWLLAFVAGLSSDEEDSSSD